MIWAKAGHGVWGLWHVFEHTLYLGRDLMENSAVPSNLSVPKVPELDWAATAACAKKGPKPGEHVLIFPHEEGPQQRLLSHAPPPLNSGSLNRRQHT